MTKGSKENPHDSELFDAIADQIATKEIEVRTERVAKGFTTLDTLKKELKKVKPDNVTYDGDGKEVSCSYSKATVTKKKALEEQIEKLEKLLEGVFTDDDGYQKFNEKLDKLSKVPS